MSVVRLESLCSPSVSIVKASVDSLLVFVIEKLFHSVLKVKGLSICWPVFGVTYAHLPDHLTGDIM